MKRLPLLLLQDSFLKLQVSSPLAHCWPKFGGVATFHREGLGSIVMTPAGCIPIDMWRVYC